MNPIFTLTLISIFLAILIESINLILQLKGKKLTKWFGKNAFNFHVIVTSVFWIIMFFFIVLLQFQQHPIFHNNIILKYFGLILLVLGGILALWALKLLGTKRALCLNFFEENVPIVKNGIYRYIKNPIDYGFWTAFIGFALFTGSLYNLIIAIEFIVIMYPHMLLENVKIT